MFNQVRRICLPVFVFLCSILMFSVNASAQVDRGAIVGTVSDSSSARIASAKITATNLETNQAVEVSTRNVRMVVLERDLGRNRRTLGGIACAW
jgi:hypothetical protein